MPKLVAGKIMRFKANIFAHKRGWATGPLVTDAKGKVIIDPRKASRDYPGLNYKSIVAHSVLRTRGSKSDTLTPKSERRLDMSVSVSISKNISSALNMYDLVSL